MGEVGNAILVMLLLLAIRLFDIHSMVASAVAVVKWRIRPYVRCRHRFVAVIVLQAASLERAACAACGARRRRPPVLARDGHAPATETTGRVPRLP